MDDHMHPGLLVQYQFIGTKSWLLGLQHLPPIHPIPTYPDNVTQYDSCLLYKQAWGNKIPPSVCRDNQPLELLYQSPHNSTAYLPGVQNSQQTVSADIFSWTTNGRVMSHRIIDSVLNKVFIQLGAFCLTDENFSCTASEQLQTGLRGRCLFDTMKGSSQVCLTSHPTNTTGPAENLS